jgi:hypothetical protein
VLVATVAASIPVVSSALRQQGLNRRRCGVSTGARGLRSKEKGGKQGADSDRGDPFYSGAAGKEKKGGQAVRSATR